ncbi:hypothetical protein TRIUR3_20869 [Triticum urartu]|uniref:Uncharacterized protein n=1 Tax=Triticum urartu TaxID=4572 RepID=M8AU16_TRIUA|nr:hypothetical protein TRIUR3_20869 [Triticum urartu]
MAASRRRILSFDIYPRPALLGAYYLSAVVGIRQRSASPPLIPRSVASRPGRPVQRRGCRRSTASRPTLSCAVHTSRCCKFWGGGSEQCSADKNVVAGRSRAECVVLDKMQYGWCHRAAHWLTACSLIHLFYSSFAMSCGICVLCWAKVCRAIGLAWSLGV